MYLRSYAQRMISSLQPQQHPASSRARCPKPLAAVFQAGISRQKTPGQVTQPRSVGDMSIGNRGAKLLPGKPWRTIWGYLVSIIGYFMVYWPVSLRFLALSRYMDMQVHAACCIYTCICRNVWAWLFREEHSHAE